MCWMHIQLNEHINHVLLNTKVAKINEKVLDLIELNSKGIKKQWHFWMSKQFLSFGKFFHW